MTGDRGLMGEKGQKGEPGLNGINGTRGPPGFNVTRICSALALISTTGNKRQKRRER